jgi:anti-sigma factor RsiW
MTAALHEIAPEEIMAHYDGELPADRAQQVSSHLEACAECRDLASALSGTSQSLEAWSFNSARELLQPNYKPLLLLGRANPNRSTSLWEPLGSRRTALTLGAAFSLVLLALLGIGVGNHSTRRMGVTRETIGGAVAPQGSSPSLEKGEPGVVAGGGGQGGGYAPMQEQNSMMVVAQTPMIAHSADLQIVVAKFEVARTAVESILARHQGYAASLSVGSPESAARTLNASLRIPSQELPAALNELKALGHVVNESQAGEEVTAEHTDLVARLKNSRETETRLQDILRNRTGKVSDVLQVEQEMARVRGEIEQMESARKTLEHRVDFAAINLTVTEEYKAKVGDSTPGIATRFHNAVVAGFTNVTDSAVGLALWFTEYLPPIIFWLAILGLPAWWFWRRAQRATASAI